MTARTEEKTRDQQLISQAKTALVLKLAAAGTTYGFSLIAAHAMGPTGFGQVAVFLSAALFLSVLGAAGQQTAALKFIPRSLAKNAPDLAMGFVRWAFQRAALTTLLLFALCLIAGIAGVRTNVLNAYTQSVMILGVSLVPLVALVDFQSHVARGYDRLVLSLVPKEIAWRAVAGIVIFALWRIAGGTPVATGTVLAILVGILAAIAVGQFVLLYRGTGRCTPNAKAETDDWKAAAKPFWISSVSNIFLANADTVIVGIIVGPKAAGFYFAANRLAMLLSFFQTSHNVVLAPLVAGCWQDGDRRASARLVQRAAWDMTKPTLLLGVAMFGLAPMALSLFGNGFEQAATPLRLLVLAGVINAAMGPGDIALNMCGFHRPAMKASAALLVLGGILLLLGAAVAGATGVAAAVLAATLMRKAVFWALARRYLDIRTDALANGLGTLRPDSAIAP